MSSVSFRSFARTLAVSLALAAGCGGAATHPAQTTPVAAQNGTQVVIVGDFDPAADRLRQDPVADAFDAIQRGEIAQARAALEAVVAHVPAGWSPVTHSARGVAVAAWSYHDLLPYTLMEAMQGAAGTPGKREVAWVGPSYSRAFQLLAYLAVEDRDLDRAAGLLDRGIALEPRAELQTERALVYGHQGQLDKALALYVQVSESAESDDAAKARAWRGRGSVLTDMGKLDDAEAAYRKSLEIEPDQKLALSELEYIQKLRAGQVKANAADIVRGQN